MKKAAPKKPEPKESKITKVQLKPVVAPKGKPDAKATPVLAKKPGQPEPVKSLVNGKVPPKQGVKPAKPGELSIAAVGPGSTFQLGLVELSRKAGVNMTYVPYNGSAPAVTALLGNHVTAAISGYAVVVEHVKAGKLRALASGTAKRIEPEPNLPTFGEAGFKGMEIDNFFGVVAPAKTPKDVTDQLASWFTAALQAPESKAKLAAQYLYAGGPCGADYGTYLRDRHDEYGKLIRDANIKVQ